MQFGSDEWIAAWRNAARVNGSVRTATAGWNFGPIALHFAGAPEVLPKGLVFRIDDGELASIQPLRAGELTPFTITASYDRLQAIIDGKLDVVDAVQAGKLGFTGDLPTLTRHGALFGALIAAASELETVFPEPAEASLA